MDRSAGQKYELEILCSEPDEKCGTTTCPKGRSVINGRTVNFGASGKTFLSCAVDTASQTALV